LQAQEATLFQQEGIASWYGREYDGRPTASGEIFNSSELTAAHPTLPFGTRLVVTNQHNNRSVTVRINDRGPFVPARIVDVSRAAAEQLDMIATGTAPVKIESIDRVVISAPAVEQVEIAPVVPPVQPVTARAVTVTSANTTQPLLTELPAAVISAPVVPQSLSQIRLSPNIVIVPDKSYRLQIGSYRVARNAVETFERLKNSGLNPAYERYSDGENSEYFRVVLAGIRGNDIQLTTEKLSVAGFREALIREEN
ncbi:MAG: septal ring lytic transglycosylase RlpA family protein, partial [Treponema sp.]|nr:septal ring lytic transglycosylase RlpA family protein [Treponema sp.]